MSEAITVFQSDASNTLLRATTTYNINGIHYGIGILIFVIVVFLIIYSFNLPKND